jgi:hypothetical protein
MRMMGMEMARDTRAPTLHLTPRSLGESHAEEAQAEEPRGMTPPYAYVCSCRLQLQLRTLADVCCCMLMYADESRAEEAEA